MRTISANLQTHLDGEVTTLATCWKVTRRDATVLGFTDHDSNLIVDSVTYLASTGFTPTAIANSADLAVDNMDVDGVLDSSAITEADILAGIYDGAAIEIFQVNAQNLADGSMILRHGTIGEVQMNNGQFTAEIRGLSQPLSQTIGELYAPACRAKFGDSRCGFNVASVTVSGNVSSVTSRQVFTDTSLTQDAGYFNFGKVTFTSGANNGLSMEVKRFAGGEVTLVLPMPYDITAGDSFSIVAGCDKSFSTCIKRFSNAVNFRGEPHVPGTDKMLQTAGTRS